MLCMSLVDRFELGTGLYLGWGGGSLSILGGGLLTCGCRRAAAAKKGWVPATCTCVCVRACMSVCVCALWMYLTMCFLPSSGFYGNQGKVYKAPAKSDQESSRAYV